VVVAVSEVVVGVVVAIVVLEVVVVVVVVVDGITVIVNPPLLPALLESPRYVATMLWATGTVPVHDPT
jgi:hypothetical protein